MRCTRRAAAVAFVLGLVRVASAQDAQTPTRAERWAAWQALIGRQDGEPPRDTTGEADCARKHATEPRDMPAVIMKCRDANQRSADIKAAADEIAQFIEQVRSQDWLRAATDDDLARVPAQIRSFNPGMQALAGPDWHFPDGQAQRGEALAVAIEKVISKEQTCRATPKCVAERNFNLDVENPLCEVDAQASDTRAAIAREKANPAGVVNLSVLHSLGATLQEQEDQLSALKRKYLAFRHKPWPGSKSQCTATEPADSTP